MGACMLLLAWLSGARQGQVQGQIGSPFLACVVQVVCSGKGRAKGDQGSGGASGVDRRCCLKKAVSFPLSFLSCRVVQMKLLQSVTLPRARWPSAPWKGSPRSFRTSLWKAQSSIDTELYIWQAHTVTAGEYFNYYYPQLVCRERWGRYI